MATPVRYPAGVTNAAPHQVLGNYGSPDPFFYAEDANDFFGQVLADWTVTKVGAGTNIVAAENGGVLLLTTTAGAADSVLYQRVAAGHTLTPATPLVAGKKAFWRIRMRCSSVVNAAITAGLINTTTAPLTAADGIQFIKASGANTFILRSSVGGVNTDLAIPAASPNTMTDAVYIELGWMFDGKGTIYAFVNPTTGNVPQSGTGATPFNKGAVAAMTPASVTTAVLNHSFGLTNGAAVARTMSVDFSMSATER